MLDRARNVPLLIDLLGASSPDILSKFPPHSRTRELRLRSLSLLHSQGVREIYPLEAPAMGYFKLEIFKLVNGPVSFRQCGRTTLFTGQAPKLRGRSLSPGRRLCDYSEADAVIGGSESRCRRALLWHPIRCSS